MTIVKFHNINTGEYNNVYGDINIKKPPSYWYGLNYES